VKRCPVILTDIINNLLEKQEAIKQDETLSENDRALALNEGSEIIAHVSRIRSEMTIGHPMPYVKSHWSTGLLFPGADGLWA